MVGFGVLLIILGLGSLVLPMFNFQFRLMEIVDPYQPWAGIIIAAVGAVLVGAGLQRSRARVTTTSTTTTTPAATAPASPPPSEPPAAEG